MLMRMAAREASPDRCAIAVMAKASIPGKTKTRLVPPLTLDQAARLNTAFLKDVSDNLAKAAQRADIAAYMAYGPPGSTSFFENNFSIDLGLIETWLPGFGDCLFHAASSLLRLGYGSVCLLNSDSPTLPTEILVEAAQTLSMPGDRIVLGPSSDGGYYLLGIKREHRRLFEDVSWSTDVVAKQTLERSSELGLDAALLPVWYDVDDCDTLMQLARDTVESKFTGSHAKPHDAAHTTAELRAFFQDGETISAIKKHRIERRAAVP